MQTFSVEAQRHGSCVVINPAGELDIATGPALEYEARAAILEAGEPLEAVRIELGEVTFLDLAGARVLVRCGELARARGARFRIEHARPQARRLFELCGLSELLD